MREPLPADMFDELCPSSLNPIRFGDKWAALIIRCLEHGPRRFSELRVPLSRVTPKVLTQSLRSLERDGLVKRTVYAEAPPACRVRTDAAGPQHAPTDSDRLRLDGETLGRTA